MGSDAKDTYNLVEVPEFADIDGRGGENLVQLAAQDAVLDLTQGFAVQGVKMLRVYPAAALTLAYFSSQ